jgi:hypothetical protein
MASREIINTIAAIERGQSADALSALLEALSSDLPNYSDANPRMHGAGNTVDSLRRVSHGLTTDPNFDLSVLIGALVHTVTDQQERIEALEGKTTKASSRRNTKRGREGAA